MRFKGLDLNLLVAFHALLEERSVIRASARLGLSQPATSSALARLRDYFQDDILVIQGRRMFATAFAEALWPHVRDCLEAADVLTKVSAKFDPASSRRTFRVVSSDYIIASLFTSLIESLAETAPSIAFDFQLPDQNTRRTLDLGEIDLFITPEEFVDPDHASELLFEERHVVVGWSENDFFREQITEASMLARGHVAVSMGSTRTKAFADIHMERLDKKRSVEVVLSSFTLVPWMLIGTQRLALMHERLARVMASRFPLRFAPLPFAFPIMREMLQYHRTRASDEGLRWLIDRIKAVPLDLEGAALPGMHASIQDVD